MDRKEHNNESNEVNMNQKANTNSRQCSTNRYIVFTSRVIFDFMLKTPSWVIKHCKSSSRKEKKKMEYLLTGKYRLIGSYNYNVYLPDNYNIVSEHKISTIVRLCYQFLSIFFPSIREITCQSKRFLISIFRDVVSNLI